jgi:hypothetical protein
MALPQAIPSKRRFANVFATHFSCCALALSFVPTEFTYSQSGSRSISHAETASVRRLAIPSNPLILGRRELTPNLAGVAQGNVEYPAGLSLVGVEIILANHETRWNRSGTIDAAGFYQCAAVPAGIYRVAARSAGFGNLGRDVVMGTAFNSFDFSVIKNTKVDERLGVQFRSENFDLFTTANFAQPGRF